MRIVVQTTEGIFRSDDVEVTPEELRKVHEVFAEAKFDSNARLSIVVHGNTMYFNPEHVVWVRVVERDEPF